MKKSAYTAQILAVGNELLRGECLDTNSGYLSKKVAPLGVKIVRVTQVSDELRELIAALKEARKKTGLLFVTGGLGPTHDDRTREALAKATGRPLRLEPSLLQTIETRFRSRNLPMPSLNRLQAYLPKGGAPLSNPIGSAPGIYLRDGRCQIFCLPGVPQEFSRMLDQEVLPILKRTVRRRSPFPFRRLRTTGLQESLVAEHLADLIEKEKTLTFGLYAHPGIVDVTVTGRKKDLSRALAAIRRRLAPFIFGKDEETMEEVVFALLQKRKKSVSVGESCTGGMISAALTSLPGSSNHFQAGIVAYQNRIKQTFLKVPQRALSRHGAVSAPVAKAMAEGARKIGRSDLGLGITGILGPTGGSREKPVGLVYIALATPKETTCHEYRFQGSRDMIRRRVVVAALELLRKELRS